MSSVKYILLSNFLIFAPVFTLADTINEAALRMSLKIAQSSDCYGGSKLGVVVIPAVDTSQSLSINQLDEIRSEFILTLGAEMPQCAILIDAETALNTVEFVAEFDASGQLTNEHKNIINQKIQNAHSILIMKVDKSRGDYVTTAQLTSIAQGHTVSAVRYYLRKEQTEMVCGVNAVAEKLGLAELADNLLDGLHPIRGIRVRKALYQDTNEVTTYGNYISQQLLVSITRARDTRIFGTTFPVKSSDGTMPQTDDSYEVAVRYWVCEENKSVSLILTAQARNGNSGVFQKDISLKLLPDGINYIPKLSQKQEKPSLQDYGSGGYIEDKKKLVGSISIQPERVMTGDILTISAMPPDDCNPFFFDLAEGGRLTPLPLNIFDQSEPSPGVIRYENNAFSKYGISIQAEDERGVHYMGFICQPAGMTKDDAKSVFRDLRAELTNSVFGQIDNKSASIVYNTSKYIISD